MSGSPPSKSAGRRVPPTREAQACWESPVARHWCPSRYQRGGRGPLLQECASTKEDYATPRKASIPRSRRYLVSAAHLPFVTALQRKRKEDPTAKSGVERPV